MRKALIEAEQAYSIQEVPVGAIIVCNNQIIGKGHNLTETLNDVTAHAEMQAITAAASYLGAKYLKGCTLYVKKLYLEQETRKEVRVSNIPLYFTHPP